MFVGTVDAAAVDALVQDIRSAVAAASLVRPSQCFAGLTSWFRTADEAERHAVAAFFREHLPEFEVLQLSGPEEALKESVAVAFAAEMSGIGKVESLSAVFRPLYLINRMLSVRSPFIIFHLLHPILPSLSVVSNLSKFIRYILLIRSNPLYLGCYKVDTQVAAGGGSMQLVQGSEVFVLEQGFREGQAELMGSRPRHAVCADLEARALNRCRILYRTDYISFLYPIHPISFVVPISLNLVRLYPISYFFHRSNIISFLYPIRPISFVVPIGLNLVRYIPYVIFASV